jgi:hypothetical protein
MRPPAPAGGLAGRQPPILDIYSIISGEDGFYPIDRGCTVSASEITNEV